VYTIVKKVTKTRYSKILVAIDGSKESINAARYAIGLAKKDRAHVIALTAMRLPSLYGWYPTESPYTWQKKYAKERKKWFEKIERLAKDNNVKIQTEIVESTMSAQGTIVKYAEEHNMEVVVVGTRGMSGFAKQLLGSTALGVVTYAHCTVIVVK
jgi:nucleotide-binding universal stress UspA family protein